MTHFYSEEYLCAEKRGRHDSKDLGIGGRAMFNLALNKYNWLDLYVFIYLRKGTSGVQSNSIPKKRTAVNH